MKGTPKMAAGSSDEGAAAKHRHYQRRTGEQRPTKKMVRQKGSQNRKDLPGRGVSTTKQRVLQPEEL